MPVPPPIKYSSSCLEDQTRCSTEGKIVSTYCNISKTRGGGSFSSPPPLVTRWCMTLRVRPRVTTITLILITIIFMFNLSIMKWRYYQSYCTCSRISRRWELFFPNSLRKLFPPVAVSMFVTFKRNFKSLIEIFLDEVFMLEIRLKLNSLDVRLLSAKTRHLWNVISFPNRFDPENPIEPP